MHSGRRRLALIVIVVMGLVGVVGAPARPAAAIPGFTLTRLAGGDRFETAATIATSTFGRADAAIVASGRDFPDALAGNYLAGRLGAPVLLAERDSVPLPTLDALYRLGVKRVTLLGGEGALGSSVLAALGAGGFDVTRIAGGDRFETAAAVAREGGAPASRTALLASGRTFPDALAAGPVAYGAGIPQLLTEPTSLSPAAANALSELGITNVLVLGGAGSVSDTVVGQLQNMGLQVGRLAGGDRYATSVAIADFAVGALGFERSHVDVATGTGFPDALAGGAHAGSGRHAVVLAEPSPSTALGAAAGYLRTHSATVAAGHVFGGAGAVDDGAVQALIDAGRGAQADANVCELAIEQLITVSRLTNLQGPLAASPEARAIARGWSTQMAANGGLSHNTATPTQLQAAGINWTAWAENVAYAGSAVGAHELFMSSAIHRGNILSSSLTHVGVGCVTDGAGTVWVTEVFYRA